MDSARRKEDDVMALAGRAGPRGLPLLYIDCGADDPFLPGNREVAAILQRRRVPYEYRETPGRHDWPYWDRQIVEVLRLIERAVR
jgi:S-formylglutathione hydrolase FrmB